MIRTISGFAVRRPVVTIVAWLAVVAAGFGIGTGVFERLNPDVGTVFGSESDQASERLEETSPTPETVTAVVVDPSAQDPALQRDVADAVEQTRDVPGVAEVSEPRPSETGEALLIQVVLEPGDDEEDAAEAAADRLGAIDAESVSVAGGPLSASDFNTQAQEDVAQAEMLSMPVVLVLLLIVFGGVLAAGLPLLVAGVGVGATFGVLYTFSLVSDVSVYAIQITTMLAVGLAVDYALLVVNRFREERAGTPDVPAAIARTVASAGRTVMFSGLTVAVALCGLVVFPDPFLRSMGLAGAAVVLVDMAAALTLLPALLALFGHRIKPARPRSGRGVFARIAGQVQRRPIITLVATAGAMVTLAAPVLDLHVSQGDPRMLPTETSTRQMFDDLTAHFPDQAQWTGDLQLVAEAPADDPGVQQLRNDVADVPGIADVGIRPIGPDASALTAVPQGRLGDDAASEAVEAIRAMPAPFEVAVTGDAARLADYQQMLVERTPWAAAIVVIGTMLLLFAFTGSVLLPIKAVLSNLLSIAAALGIVVWVFQYGNLAGLVGTQGLDYVHLTVPVLIGAIAFGLSVDYEVFLLSRIRERWLAGVGPERAVAEGLQRTGGIVTAAALVIAVVFAGFVFGGFAPIKAIGLGLVLAIALDATIVRMLLVPATMTLLGRWNWWLPRPLAPVHARLAMSESADEAAPSDDTGTDSDPVVAGRE
ncbi:RND superfamily putative drug exporter [Haloactinopolyspora alba]|uniref:RND superfamily putative drug exporter n=1 Tax=Haloactinopolyspora alba TaxID=648780 RepID=A0A2P8DVV3_9ACTN|nr:efflux RND transporter permease subunit [Haloactinopolyspora alba]PSL01297.1 RND superfamily putative drug exporter [Haloactinopolyspora alba]